MKTKLDHSVRSVYFESSMIVIAIRLVFNLPIRGYVVYPINILNKVNS